MNSNVETPPTPRPLSEYAADNVRAAFEAEGEQKISVEDALNAFIAEGAPAPQPYIPRNTPVPFKEFIPEDVGPIVDSPLFNRPIPNRIILKYKRENSRHRVIAFMIAQGRKYTDIAEELGISSQTVGNVSQLPWVRELVREEQKRTGQAAMHELLQVSALESVQVLLEVRDNKGNRPADRIKSCEALLDRAYGRPNQPISTSVDLEVKTLTDEELFALVAGRTAN